MKNLIKFCESRHAQITHPSGPIQFPGEDTHLWADLLNKLNMEPYQISTLQRGQVHYLRLLEKHYGFRLQDQVIKGTTTDLHLRNGSRLGQVICELKTIEATVRPYLVQDEKGNWKSTVFARYDETDHYSELTNALAVECPDCNQVERLDDYMYTIKRFSKHTNIFNCCGKWFRFTPKAVEDIPGATETLWSQESDLYDTVDEWLYQLDADGFDQLQFGDKEIPLDTDDFMQEASRWEQYYRRYQFLTDGTATVFDVNVQAGYSCDQYGDFITTGEDADAVKHARVVNILEGQDFYDRLSEDAFKHLALALAGRYAYLLDDIGIDRLDEKVAKRIVELLEEDD